MKTIRTKGTVWVALLGIALGDASGLARGAGEPGLASQIQRERSAPERSGPLGGYAAIVERVSPSVVSILTSKKVRQRSLQDYPFYFEDPFFRRFFGDPFDPEVLPRHRRQLPEQRRQGLGSGVILTQDGSIVTNNHVIDGADEIEVQLTNSRKTYEATVVGRDPATDLALLRIDARDLPAAIVGDSSQLKPGDVVLAIGNPFGLNQTVTTGIVSAIGRKNLDIVDYSNFIQTDASINPGNSGGALIDNRGRLVGINTAIFSRSGGNIGIGFAIPVNMAVNVLNRLSTDGEIQRGYLGVMLSDLTSELAEGFGVEARGALVNEVMEDTPAERAGFEPGDIIVGYQGREVTDMAELRLRVANTPPGTRAEFEILRNGQRKTLMAKIGRLSGKDQLASNNPWGRSQSDQFLPGVRISDLDRETRAYYRIPVDLRGVLVTRTKADSEAARAGLREGDVITSVAGQTVGSVREALAARRNLDTGVLVLRVANGHGSRFLAVEVENGP